MLRSIKIENFRGFRSFELQKLGRLNLLVGLNNSGKTSILEAIQLLSSRNNAEPFIDMMVSRGEYLWDDHRKRRELYIHNLFYDHKIQPDSQFSISGVHNNSPIKFTASVSIPQIQPSYDPVVSPNELSVVEPNEAFDSEPDFKEINFILEWKYGERGGRLQKYPLLYNGSLVENHLRRRVVKNISLTEGIRRREDKKTQFITPSGLTVPETIELFDRIVLTPEEQLVQEALQIVEPRIKRVAALSFEGNGYPESRGGFVVSLADSDQRIPIGSLGDGTWRMLGLALATVNAADGVLLVDEIDTGLHFTTMVDMWNMIWETAKRLNVQVFATTHSSDCWMSLASLARQLGNAEDGITIQRIERDKTSSIAFNERQIVIAAENDIEVR